MDLCLLCLDETVIVLQEPYAQKSTRQLFFLEVRVSDEYCQIPQRVQAFPDRVMHGARWYDQHCPRLDSHLFLANSSQTSPFNVEDCLFDRMGVGSNYSSNFDISDGECVARFRP